MKSPILKALVLAAVPAVAIAAAAATAATQPQPPADLITPLLTRDLRNVVEDMQQLQAEIAAARAALAKDQAALDWYAAAWRKLMPAASPGKKR